MMTYNRWIKFICRILAVAGLVLLFQYCVQLKYYHKRKHAPMTFGGHSKVQKDHAELASPLSRHLALLESQYVPVHDNLTSPIRKRFPSAILLGAFKSGTGTFMKFLALHPSVVTIIIETFFFSLYYDRGYEWYKQIMPLSKPDQITVTKTANYMYNNSVPERIYAFNSSIKLFMMLRNPMDRVLSWYAHQQAIFRHNNETLKPLEELILDPITKEINPDAKPILTGTYSKFIPMWFKRFPRDQILIMDGDLFVKDPYVVMQQVERFLGVGTYFTRDMFHFNETKGFYCPLDAEGNENCMGKNKGRTHMDISIELRSKMYNFFRPFNRKLEEITGLQFSWTDCENCQT